MSPRRSRQFLILLSLLLLVISGGVLWWGMNDDHTVTIDQQPADQPVKGPDFSSVSVKDDPWGLTTESFASTWERPLRRALYDPPPPPKPPPPEKKPPPPVRATLMATMIETDQSMAMLRLGNGDVVFRKAGDQVSPDDETAVIAEIKPGLVVVHQGEHVTELKLNGGR